MKLIILGGLPSGMGGMETVFKKFNHLLKNDFDIEFVAFTKKISGHNLDWTKNTNIDVITSNAYFRPFQKISYKKQFIKKINQSLPELIIAYDDIGCLIAYDSLKKTKHKCKLVSWCHFSFDSCSYKYKSFINKADHHLAIASEIKLQMINYGIDQNHIDTIFNPVSEQEKIVYRSNESLINFLYIGRIQYLGQKNLQEIFIALSKLNFPYQLHIVGDGSPYDKEKLKNLSLELGISEQIIFHGWQKNPWDYVINNIRNIDALLLSSKYEGLAMVLLEAMSYGLFCIASDCPTGTKDVITDKNGLLYEMGKVDDFVDKLNDFKSMNKPSYEEIKSSITQFYDSEYKIRLKNLILNKYIKKRA